MMTKEAPRSRIFFVALFVFVVAVGIANAVKFARCFSAAKDVPPLDYYIMRVKFYGSSDVDGENTVSANFSILDPQGNDCAVIERSWKGNYLFLTFRTAEFSGRTFWFPEKIYGSETIDERGISRFGARGTSLYPYYVDGGQCFLRGRLIPSRQRKKLFQLAKFAFSPLSFFFKGFSKKHVVSLSSLVTGETKSIYCTADGSVYMQ